jgi:hypothetical protein
MPYIKGSIDFVSLSSSYWVWPVEIVETCRDDPVDDRDDFERVVNNPAKAPTKVTLEKMTVKQYKARMQ